MTNWLNHMLSHRRATLYVMIVWEIMIGYAYWTGTRNTLVGVGSIAVAPSLVAYMLARDYGWPKYWWAAYFGTSVDVNVDRHLDEFPHVDGLTGAVRDWLQETNIQPRYQTNIFRHQFLRKKHAIMFKLRWG